MVDGIGMKTSNGLWKLSPSGLYGFEDCKSCFWVENNIGRHPFTLPLRLNDAMDEKLGDLKGDLVVLMRKEDKKLTELVNVLKERHIISEEDVKRVLGMEPFPQISLS